MKGVPWVVVILVACVYVYRETGLYRVFVTGYSTHLSPLLFVPRNWPLYTRDTCPFFEPPRYLRSSSSFHRTAPSASLSRFSIAIFLFLRSSRNQIKHLQRFPSRTFEFWILTENYTNIRVFKLVNRERDIDKVWRDWNVYCFEEKKREKIIAILKAFTVSAIIRGLVTCRKKEISCQCFASIVTSFFEGRKKLAEERCYGETLGRYSFLLDTIYTRKPRMVTNGVPLCSLDFLPFLNLPTILLSYYSSISSNSNRFNKLLFFAIPILFLSPDITHPLIERTR